jgi:hypothetical protein
MVDAMKRASNMGHPVLDFRFGGLMLARGGLSPYTTRAIPLETQRDETGECRKLRLQTGEACNRRADSCARPAGYPKL